MVADRHEGAFFVAEDGGFRGTAHTSGPWDPEHSMHFGPPAALLGRALTDAVTAERPMRLARVTFELLSAVPIGWLSIETTIIRPGRRVTLVEATLATRERVVAIARGWLVRETTLDLPELTQTAPPLPPRGSGRPQDFFPMDRSTHYGSSVEVVPVRGTAFAGEPAAVWMRPLVPLIAGSAPHPLDAVLIVADSINGVSSPLWFGDWNYVNVDLSIHLARHPVDEWVGMDCATDIDASGIGQSRAVLHDRDGIIGTAAQSLFVDRR